jgi:SAM-dependent methyltransferase
MSASSYFAGLNLPLLRAVPQQARRIVEVGCAEGRLGAALKEGRPDRYVWGLDAHPASLAVAATRLDWADCCDIERDDPPIEAGSMDAVIFGDVLEHLRDPEAVLSKVRRWLGPKGQVVASVPNLGHHSVLTGLLGGEFPYADAGLLDRTHVHFFTRSSLQRTFLNAGFVPDIVDRIVVPMPDSVWEASRALRETLGLPPERTRLEWETYQFIVRAEPIAEQKPLERVADTAERPLSFVVCVNNERVFRENLLASPDLGSGTPHQVIALQGIPNAAEGLRIGREHAVHPTVVWVHQDVYLPRGWSRRMAVAWQEASDRFGPLGLAGVYGIGGRGDRAVRVGRVVDRWRRLDEGVALPREVDSLDELLLAMPRDQPIEFDANLGYHLYGTDGCLRAKRLGHTNVVLDLPCLHNSAGSGLPADFGASVQNFLRAWPDLDPDSNGEIATPCVKIRSDGTYREW